MSIAETELPPVNQQGLDIRSTPRAEMKLYPLDTFPYEFAGREVHVQFEIPEFTCVCPFSDFPDFATFRLDYVPNERCIELKSLKLYINSFREVKIFEGDFNVRGNIKTVVKASYRKSEQKEVSGKR
jgi:7-cyano-7-deazaguanine reductase